MLRRGDGALLCVSGGPDSVALLLLFLEVKKEFNLRLHVAHLNHGLRGSESDEDEMYVKALCEKFKLPVSVAKLDIGTESKKIGRGIEETARIARYDFFYESAKSHRLEKIAIAHTRDDQAETILMRLIRGAGLGGLCGIAPVRAMKDKMIIRPLIDISRKELEYFLSKKRITPRQDPTNLKPLYFRNKIRLELLPLLEREYNVNIKELLANTASTLQADYSYILKSTQAAFKVCAKKKEGEIFISRGKFSKCHPALQRRLLRRAVEEVKGDLRRIEYRHWQEFWSLIAVAKDGALLDLPMGVKIEKKKDFLRIRDWSIDPYPPESKKKYEH